MTNKQFVDTISRLGAELYRDMPWRHAKSSGEYDAYKILVSECMLQQTQVARVIPKFEAFISKYPTLRSLAEASFADVLLLWSGLGYNRRAQFLHEAAKTLHTKTRWTYDDLMSCKGIGPNTASAVLAYAYNDKVTFIETNIRTVYIHYFYQKKQVVTDEEITKKQKVVSKYITDYRHWYWALMDVGSYLKSQNSGHLTKAKSYTKQSKFNGSRRQIRGMIIKRLLQSDCSLLDLQKEINDERLEGVIETLVAEKIIAFHEDILHIVR